MTKAAGTGRGALRAVPAALAAGLLLAAAATALLRAESGGWAVAVAALALAALAALARVARLAILAPALGARASPAAFAGAHLAGRALSVGLLRGAGAVLEWIWLARRGARARPAGALALSLASADVALVAALALAASAWLGARNAEVDGALRASAIVAGVALVAVLAAFAALPREARVAAPARALALTLAAAALEAAALGAAALAAGAAPVRALAMGALARGAALGPLVRPSRLPPEYLLSRAFESAGGAYASIAGRADLAAAAVVAFALAAGAVAICAWAFRPARGAWRKEDLPLVRSERAALAAILAGAAWIRVALAAPEAPYGFVDGRAHDEYVLAVLSGNLAPMAQELLMAYHPPLWYWLAAPFRAALGPAGLVLVELAIALAGLLALHAALRAAGVPQRARLASTAVAALLPAHALLSTSATNDLLAAGLVAGALALGLSLLEAPASRGRAIAFGALAGLALLAKATAVLPLAVLGAAILLARRGRIGADALLAGAVATALAGAWYARNLWVFRRPFVSNMDFFGAREGPPLGPRWLAERLLDTGFDGLVPANAPAPPALALLAGSGALLAAGVALSALAVAGAVVVARRGSRAERALLTILAALALAQLAYYRAYPDPDSLSARYFLVALPAFAALAWRGAGAASSAARWAAAVAQRAGASRE